MENGACYFRVIMLTWHFDAFHIQYVPLQCSPLRIQEHLKEFEYQVFEETQLLGHKLEEGDLHDGKPTCPFLYSWVLTNNVLGPWRARTYNEKVPGTTETITWTRPGRVWTQPEVEVICDRFVASWIKYFGSMEQAMLYSSSKGMRVLWH